MRSRFGESQWHVHRYEKKISEFFFPLTCVSEVNECKLYGCAQPGSNVTIAECIDGLQKRFVLYLATSNNFNLLLSEFSIFCFLFRLFCSKCSLERASAQRAIKDP